MTTSLQIWAAGADAPTVTPAPGTCDGRGRLDRGSPARSHNRGIDGLRAVAVLNVIAGHLHLPLGGNQGVTVFFVISGYLITSLLLDEVTTTATLDLVAFYRRRIARLGPAMLSATATYVVFLLATGVSVSQWWTGLVGTLTYSNDVILAAGTGRQGHGAAFTWSWSLGIEEQFYLVWPLLIVVVFRSRRGRLLLSAASLVIIETSWLIRERLSVGHPAHGRVFFSFDTHMDAIAWGALLALAAATWTLTRRRQLLAQLAFPLALASCLALHVTRTASYRRLDSYGFGLVALLSVIALAGLVAAPNGIAGRVLGSRPVAYLGRLSYGLYLWNYLFVLAMTRLTHHQPPFPSPLDAVAVTALVGVAAASYQLVEQPLRRRWAPRPVSPAGSRPGSDAARRAEPEWAPAPAR